MKMNLKRDAEIRNATATKVVGIQNREKTSHSAQQNQANSIVTKEKMKNISTHKNQEK